MDALVSSSVKYLHPRNPERIALLVSIASTRIHFVRLIRRLPLTEDSETVA